MFYFWPTRTNFLPGIHPRVKDWSIFTYLIGEEKKTTITIMDCSVQNQNLLTNENHKSKSEHKIKIGLSII